MDLQVMNDNDTLPLDSNITKLVKNTQIQDGPVVDGKALMPRDTEDYMSVNWLEHDGDEDIDTCMGKIINIYKTKLTPKNNSWLPIINVKSAIDYIDEVYQYKRRIHILYKPELKPDYEIEDLSHSGVFGYTGVPHEDAELGDLLSKMVFNLRQLRDYE